MRNRSEEVDKRKYSHGGSQWYRELVEEESRWNRTKSGQKRIQREETNGSRNW